MSPPTATGGNPRLPQQARRSRGRTTGYRTVAFSNSASPEIIWGLGGPEEDHQLHHCCWTGRVSELEEEEEEEHV